jgi:TRAP-type C4-dicarboxylate transport system permease small subunit
MEEHLAPPPWTVTGGTTWAGVLGGPLAWFASQQVSYMLVPWACHGGPLIAILLANLVALAIVALAGWFSWREWRRAGPQVSDERAPPEDRQRFLGLMSLALAVLFGLVIIAQAAGAFFFGPCER